MIKINKTVISELNPCKNRFDNYVKHYQNHEFTIQKFMGLKNITHDDKVWVAFRLMRKDDLRLVAADIAELVLPIYEKEYPNDDRPRKAIEAVRSGVNTDAAYAARAADAARAAHAAADAARAADAAAYAARPAYADYAARAAYDAAHAAAYAAADAARAADAAAYAAYAADAADAAHAAAYAAQAAAYAAYAAADAAAEVGCQKKIRTILIKYLKKVKV